MLNLRNLALAAMFVIPVALNAQSGPIAANTDTTINASAPAATDAPENNYSSISSAQPGETNAAPAYVSKKQQKKAESSNLQPDDPKKNPYWEPRDWNYINNNTQ